MAKTAKERQEAYRKRRPHAGTDGNGERRLNTWIGTGASLALERLSNRYGVTKREMLERLIVAEDKRILSGIVDGGRNPRKYGGTFFSGIKNAMRER
jgi:hypothetical protein